MDCIVTSPPYWGLRDYGVAGQIGVESTPEEYLTQIVAAMQEARRVLRPKGTAWIVIGDSYANDEKWGGASGGKHIKELHGATSIGRGRRRTGLKPKDLVGIAWRVAFALQADGWWLRSDIIWAKPNPMPESVRDRPTKAHEYVFLLAKSERYYYDAEAIMEPLSAAEKGGRSHTISLRYSEGSGRNGDSGLKNLEPLSSRNSRSVWTIATRPYSGAHFATFPEELARTCILAGCPVCGTVLDPFAGSGTVGKVSIETGRNALLCDLSYQSLAKRRISGVQRPLRPPQILEEEIFLEADELDEAEMEAP